jgi:archaellum component FlaC
MMTNPSLFKMQFAKNEDLPTDLALKNEFENALNQTNQDFRNYLLEIESIQNCLFDLETRIDNDLDRL